VLRVASGHSANWSHSTGDKFCALIEVISRKRQTAVVSTLDGAKCCGAQLLRKECPF
jgi:hypothetical protein